MLQLLRHCLISGIGIVRISGDDAIEIGSRVYRSKNGCHSLKDYGSHTIHYGFIMDGEEILDEVMAAVMKAPNSYTKEDTVEIQLSWRCLNRAESSGNRTEEWGQAGRAR